MLPPGKLLQELQESLRRPESPLRGLPEESRVRLRSVDQPLFEEWIQEPVEIVYGISGNTRSWYDNSNAARLGYRPQDNSEAYAAEVFARAKSAEIDDNVYQGGSFVNVEH